MNIRTLLPKLILGLVTLTASLQVRATPIASYSDIYAVFASTGPWQFSYGASENFVPGGPNTLDVTLLTVGSFSNSAWGTSYTLNAGNTPTFDAFVAMLTDGEADRLGRIITSSGGSGGGSNWESTYLFGDPTGASGVDLIGYNISEITIAFAEDHTLDFLNPQLQGKYTVSFFGSLASVPDTGSVLGLLSLGLVGLGLLRRRAHA